MRALLIFAFTLMLAALPARAASCSSRWRVDHYVHDAALHRDWAVMVNCEHPDAPARMAVVSRRDANVASSAKTARQIKVPSERRRTAAEISVKVGEPVEVSNSADSVASMQLAGTAQQAGHLGQTIRVRLNTDGHFVSAIVRGPHSVELVASIKPTWRQP